MSAGLSRDWWTRQPPPRGSHCHYLRRLRVIPGMTAEVVEEPVTIRNDVFCPHCEAPGLGDISAFGLSTWQATQRLAVSYAMFLLKR